MEPIGARFFKWIPFLRGAGPPALREDLLPASPSLSGAFALANTVAAGHPLGFARFRAVRGVKLLQEAKPCVRGTPLYRVAVVTSGRRSAGQPALEVSWRGTRVVDRLQSVLNALYSFPRGVGVFAEVAGVPPRLEMVELPWFALSEKAERLFAPGFKAFLHLAAADLREERELALVDWREPPPGERAPRPREMMLYAGRTDGKVFYAVALNAARLAEW